MRQTLYCPRCSEPLEKADSSYICQGCTNSYPIVDGIPSFVDQDVEVDSFDPSVFEFLFKMEERHFWHVGRKELVLDFLKRSVPGLAKARMLEIGCGNGNILTYLKRHGVNMEGGDILMDGLRFCHR